MKKLDRLKQQYHDVEVPDELENIVQSTIQREKKARKRSFPLKQLVLSAAALFILFIGSINMNPKMASAMLNIPLIGTIVEVFTIKNFTVSESSFDADLAVPAITGLEDAELQNGLNEKYLQENEALFEQFKEDMVAMKKASQGQDEAHLGLNSIYDVITDTDQLFSIARYTIETQASSAKTVQYDTIDKERNIVITLPSLFTDDRYIERISEHITLEMNKQMERDQSTSYFLHDDFIDDFKTIHANQNFYISNNHKLVISFDEYEVAPGYMGVVKFEIPTEVIKDLLVSDLYIH